MMKKNKQKHRRKSNSKAMLFMKVLLITLAAFSIVIVSGWAFMRSFIRPPDIPQESVAAIEDGPAFHPPEGQEDDMNIGSGLLAPEGFTDDDRKEQFYTFLIIGKDEGINTDTIMVASYDGVNHEACIISVPRDSLVNVKRNIKKINAAFPAGTLYGGGTEGGITQLKRELSTIIGFVPDFFVTVDLDAFVKIVDAVSGIEVDVPSRMQYDDPYQDLYIDIQEGRQLLNGRDALRFARYRQGNDPSATITDYERIEHQQTVIKAVLAKLVKPENILKIPEFIDIFNENVSTDVKVENMLWFADQLNKIRGTDALSTYTIPTIGTSGPPNYYELLDEAAIVDLVNKTINPYKKNIETKDLDIITDDYWD